MCAHLWRADACAQGVPVARTADMGILKNTREFTAPGAGKWFSYPPSRSGRHWRVERQRADGRAWRRKTGKQAVCAHLWRADACAPTVSVARTADMGILKNTRDFTAPGAGKLHTSEVRGGGRDPDVRRPGSGLGRPTARSTGPARSRSKTGPSSVKTQT